MAHKVFLCSCTNEILEHRMKVYELLHDFEHEWECVSSDDIGIDEALEQYQESKNLIPKSDLCIAIIGHFYGDELCVDGQFLSLPAAEVNLAASHEIDILIFMASDDFLIPARFLKDFSNSDVSKQRKFRARLIQRARNLDENGEMVLRYFNSLDDLLHQVEVEFHKWLRRRQSKIGNLSDSKIPQGGLEISGYIDLVSNLPVGALIEKILLSNYLESNFLISQEMAFRNLLHNSPLGSTYHGFQNRSAETMHQDISPYVPLLLEVTKFFVNEVSKWIDDVRKRASAPPKLHKLPTEFVSLASIVKSEDDPNAIITLLGETLNLSDLREAQSLIKQIRRQRHLLNSLEERAILATGGELASIDVQMTETADDIIEKVERLEALLKRIYKDKLDSDSHSDMNQRSSRK
ncbi:MAG: hypothetical protein D6732_02465 [Methanobacteriota archaeon]|nr:MAG: hypothetical protein D6732_02465 [Euryarchaeota archaeon]